MSAKKCTAIAHFQNCWTCFSVASCYICFLKFASPCHALPSAFPSPHSPPYVRILVLAMLGSYSQFNAATVCTVRLLSMHADELFPLSIYCMLLPTFTCHWLAPAVSCVTHAWHYMHIVQSLHAYIMLASGAYDWYIGICFPSYCPLVALWVIKV